jgi:hypothetical protein
LQRKKKWFVCELVVEVLLKKLKTLRLLLNARASTRPTGAQQALGPYLRSSTTNAAVAVPTAQRSLHFTLKHQFLRNFDQ